MGRTLKTSPGTTFCRQCLQMSVEIATEDELFVFCPPNALREYKTIIFTADCWEWDVLTFSDLDEGKATLVKSLEYGPTNFYTQNTG